MEQANSLAVALEDYERQYVLSVLADVGGNRTAAARTLQISVRWLQFRLRQWRLAGHAIPDPPTAVSAIRSAIWAVGMLLLSVGLAVAHGTGPGGTPGGGASAGAPAGIGTEGGADVWQTGVGVPGAKAREMVPVQACLFGRCWMVYRIPKAQEVALDAHRACNGTGFVVLERLYPDGRIGYRSETASAAAAYRRCLELRGFRFSGL